MPLAIMDKLYEETDFCSGSDSQSPQNWDQDQTGGRVCQRRQRNRDAARKSRKKQTERADVLHEELQTLERSNAALVKEISELEKELQRYTTALKEHESHCTLSWSGPSIPDMSTSDLAQAFNGSIDEPVFPVPDFNIDDILERTEWMPWDSDMRLPPV